jgi:hypothetical protein
MFITSSTSSATDSHQQAGDNANLVHGKGIVTEAGGLTLSGRSNYLSPGSAMLGNKSGNTTTNIKVGKKGALTIQQGASTDTISAMLGQVQTATNSQIRALTDAISNQQTAKANGDPAGLITADHQAAAAANPTTNLKWLWLVPAAVVLWLFFKK